jgi:monoamine oxidase
VFLVFSAAFWPEDLFDVVCTDSFLPEFWVTRYPPVPGGAAGSPASPEGQFVVTGFAAGTRAEELSQYRDGTIIIKALKQLDLIFGEQFTRQRAV